MVSLIPALTHLAILPEANVPFGRIALKPKSIELFTSIYPFFQALGLEMGHLVDRHNRIIFDVVNLMQQSNFKLLASKKQ
jgi:hypothetical protein